MSSRNTDFWDYSVPPSRARISRAHRWSIAVAAGAATVVMVSVWAAHAAPPAGADMTLAPWFQSLGQPDTGYPCCSIADCRTVQSRTRGDHFEVFIDRKTFGESAPDAWVAVPPESVIRRKDNPLGEPVACWHLNEVRCFVQGTAA